MTVTPGPLRSPWRAVDHAIGLPRLLGALDRLPPGGVLALTGPAAAGKTALLDRWCAGVEHLVRIEAATLPPADMRGVPPPRIAGGAGWPDLVAALASPQPARRLAAVLPPHCVIVVDDVHLIGDPADRRALSALATHLPPSARLVVSGRGQPPLTVSRLRMQGRFLELDAADLAARPDELLETVTERGLALSPGALEHLMRLTGGWLGPLTIALDTAGRATHPERAVAGLRAAAPPLQEFVTEEVLAGWTKPERGTLQLLSVGDVITAHVAREVAGGDAAEALLPRLVDASLVRSHPGVVGAWALLPLLAEWGRCNLALTHPELVPRLRARIARLPFARPPVTVVQEAIVAADAELLADRVRPEWTLVLSSGAGRRLVEPLDGLPAGRLASDPRVGLAAAATYVSAGRFRAAERVLDLLDPARLTPEQRLPALLLRQWVQACAGDPGEAARRVSAALEGHAEGAGGPAVAAAALACLGVAFLWGGAGPEAELTLRSATRAARQATLPFLRATAEAYLALGLACHGALAAGHDMAAEVLAAADGGGWHDLPDLAAAHLAHAWTHLQRQELAAVQPALLEADQLLRGTDHRALLLVLALLEARAEQAAGRPRAGLAQLTGLARAVDAQEAPGWMQRWLRWTAADLWVDSGDPARARAELQRDASERTVGLGAGAPLARVLLAEGQPAAALATLRAVTDDGDRTWATVRGDVLAALAAERLGRRDDALSFLQAALRRAEPEQLIHPFSLDGVEVRLLLTGLLRRGTPRWRFATQVLGALPQPEPAADILRRHGVYEPLTERELEILRLLPAPLTAPDLAAQTYVSVNTVRTHMKAIFRKLGVNSRRAAVARAEALGLL